MSSSLIVPQRVLCWVSPFHSPCYDPDSNITLSHCFEKLCTHSKAIKPHGEFFSVVQRKIGDFNVIMAGEVDCSSGARFHQTFGDGALISVLQVDGGVPCLDDYIELKTVGRPDSSHCVELFRRWYLQSYLLGVKTLKIGYRELGEEVSKIEEKTTNGVLQDARKFTAFNPAGAFGRAHAIFLWLRGCLRSLESGKTSSAEYKFNLRIGANHEASLTSIMPVDATV